MQAAVLPDLNQNDILSDLSDTLPGDDVLALPAQKTENLSGTGEDQGFDTAGFTVEGEVHRATQISAGAAVDHFFLFQFAYAHDHRTLFFYVMFDGGRGMYYTEKNFGKYGGYIV